MLVLGRFAEQRVQLDTHNGPITVAVLGTDGKGQVKLGIEAPDSVEINRTELLESPAHPDGRAKKSRPQRTG